MPSCVCGQSFYDDHSLFQHQLAQAHLSCPYCKRRFKTVRGLERHDRVFHSWTCGHCDTVFSEREHLTAHQKHTNHCYCKECDRHFTQTWALRQHRNSVHVNEYYCCDCDRNFVSERALEQHLTNKIHTITRSVTTNFMCIECDIEFGGERALEQHRASLIHHPLSDIECVTSKCKKRFASPSALLHHLESGGCPSGINRQKLNALVQTQDLDRMISSSPDDDAEVTLAEVTRRLEMVGTSDGSGYWTPTNTDSASVSASMSDSDLMLFTPGSDHPDYEYPSWLQSGQSTNALTISGSSVRPSSLMHILSTTTRCPICPTDRPPFQSFQSLQQHLNSAAHASRMFRCPVSLFPPPTAGQDKSVMMTMTMKMKGKSFSTLSGLAQHLESGACVGGVTTFREMARYVETRLRDLDLGWKGKLLLGG